MKVGLDSVEPARQAFKSAVKVPFTRRLVVGPTSFPFSSSILPKRDGCCAKISHRTAELSIEYE